MVTNHTCVFESIQISRGKYVFGALLTVRKLLAWYLIVRFEEVYIREQEQQCQPKGYYEAKIDL